jgi:hypothetical protein
MTDAPQTSTPNSSPIAQTALTPLTNNKNPPEIPQAPTRNPYTNNKTNKKAAGTFSCKKRVSMTPPNLPQPDANSDITYLPTSTITNNPAPNNSNPDNTQQSTLPTQDVTNSSIPNQTTTRDDSTQCTQFSSQSTYQTSNPHIPINNGRQRLTIRWKPANFEHLNLFIANWDIQAAKMVQELFHNFSDKINAVIWEEKKTEFTSIDSLNSANIRQYLSPKISALPSTQTYIFGLRLSAGANIVGNWLNNEYTRLKMDLLEVEATISNAKCTSGNVVTAGCILFKHPIYTHRLYYLLSLRKTLTKNTPFFDLGIHRRTLSGDEIPHLVIKCGEHHLQGLTDILASHLDGKNTSAVFVPQPAIKSMTEEETKAMFDAHQLPP